VSACGPRLCGYLWPGADVAYLHVCCLPALPVHRVHECDEGVRLQTVLPRLQTQDRLGELLADAVTGLFGEAGKPRARPPN
jgi:hypothetical protein